MSEKTWLPEDTKHAHMTKVDNVEALLLQMTAKERIQVFTKFCYFCGRHTPKCYCLRFME